jgi:RNA polymerase sporulation-specific sigma factor
MSVDSLQFTADSYLDERKTAADKLAENNLRLVHSVARRFNGRGIEYEELYSAGCVGLVKAAKNFDESRGLMFSTYAVPVIMGEIRRMFRDGGAIKVSRSLKELSLRVTKTRERLAMEKGEEPHLSEIADVLGISVEDVSEALCVSRPPVSLTKWTDSDDGGDFDVPVVAPQLKLTETIALKQILHTLPPKDRRLIFLRYWGEKTQGETGKALNMSQVQVSRREKKILEILRIELDN